MSIEMPKFKAAEFAAESTAPILPPRQIAPIPTRAPNRWLQAIPLLIVLAAFAPLMVMHGVSLWGKPHYQFFPLVLIGTLVLGYFACQRQGRLNPGRYQLVALGFGFLSLL